MLKATEDWGQTYKLDTDRCRRRPVCRRGLGLAVYGLMAAVVTLCWVTVTSSINYSLRLISPTCDVLLDSIGAKELGG